MDQKDVLERLSRLTKRQREVLWLRCDGLDYQTIADRLSITGRAVKAHMANIYDTLDLRYAEDASVERTQAERSKLLFEVYCPALKGAQLAPPPPEPEELEEAPPELERMLDEDEQALVPWVPAAIVSIPPQPVEPVSERPRPRRLRWLLLGVLLGVALALAIFIGFGALGREATGVAEAEVPTDTPVVQTVVVTVLQTVEVVREVLVTLTPGPPDTILEPVIVTQVVVVTATPLPDTPLPPPPTARPASLLFEDDFNQGLSPAWERGYGQPFIVNDMLSADQETWLSIGDPSWRDYRIEFEADASSCWMYGGREGNVIAPRFVDADNMIAFMWADCECYWYIVRDGVWKQVPGQEPRLGVGGGVVRLTITARGDQFIVHVNGQRLTSLNDDSFQVGRVGLRLARNTLIDNFRIETLED